MTRTSFELSGVRGGIPRTPFVFLRHGRTEWNALGRAMGAADIPLDATGLAEAREAAATLPGLGIARIVASPLSRARVTAEIAGETLKLPVAIDADLRECAWGSREGKPYDGWLERWHEGETPDGAEPRDAFFARVRDGVTRAIAAPGLCLIVAHGGVYWGVCAALGLPRAGTLANATPMLLRPEGSAWHSGRID